MTAIVDQVWKYPVKGARGNRVDCLFLDPERGVIGNRQYAIRKTPGNLGEWDEKKNFFVCMNTPGMAVQVPKYQSEALGPYSGLHPVFVSGLVRQLKLSGDAQIQNTNRAYNLTDTKGPSVSFINLASVRAVAEYMGVEVNPERFRMDVWFDGLEPFKELEWVDTFHGTRIIEVGGLRFRVDDACERCTAIEANPETGEKDLALLDALDEIMRKRGYQSPHRRKTRVMGILAEPLTKGALVGGEEIYLVA